MTTTLPDHTVMQLRIRPGVVFEFEVCKDTAGDLGNEPATSVTVHDLPADTQTETEPCDEP